MKRIFLVGLFGCAHAAAPAVGRVAPTRTLGPALASLGFYLGDWSCSVTDENGKVAKDYPILEIKVAPVYANWFSIEVWDHDTQITSEMKGVDEKGLFHHIWTSGDGAYGSLSSKGWEGARLVFEEDHPDASSKTRMTFTKLDATHYTHLSEVDTGTGWKTEFQKTCHKV